MQAAWRGGTMATIKLWPWWPWFRRYWGASTSSKIGCRSPGLRQPTSRHVWYWFLRRATWELVLDLKKRNRFVRYTRSAVNTLIVIILTSDLRTEYTNVSFCFDIIFNYNMFCFADCCEDGTGVLISYSARTLPSTTPDTTAFVAARLAWKVDCCVRSCCFVPFKIGTFSSSHACCDGGS